MMNNCFSMNNNLDFKKIYEYGYASQPFPEHISGDEIKSVMTLLEQDYANVWVFEFGHMPELMKDKSIEEVSRIVFEDSHMNIFIELAEIELFFWLPEGQDHFVIFGKKSVVRSINSRNIFNYSFDEYIREEYFSKDKTEYLINIQKQFKIE